MQVSGRGHPIFPLSRKKLFKEKSIDRKPAFFLNLIKAKGGENHGNE